MTIYRSSPSRRMLSVEVRKRLNAAGIDVDSLTGDDREVALLAMMNQCVAESVFDGTADCTYHANRDPHGGAVHRLEGKAGIPSLES